MRCGARRLAGAVGPRWVFSCVGCGVPFSAERLLAHDAQRCATCGEGRASGGLPDPELAEATEAEVRRALDRGWRLVGEAGLCRYLDRVAGSLSRHIGGSTLRPRVVLVDEASFRTLALPSGTLLISLGVLHSLDNEAELAFVLGHELAHAASSDATARLVRLGFESVRREDDQERDAWALAVEDLVRVGYGRRRERDADAHAIEAMLAEGYDPAAGPALLRRLERRMRDGDERLAELATSHPTPEDRSRRVERVIHALVRGGESLRLNREVYRRVAGPAALGRPLGSVPLDVPEAGPAAAARQGLPGWVAAAAGVALIAALILLLGFLLTH